MSSGTLPPYSAPSRVAFSTRRKTDPRREKNCQNRKEKKKKKREEHIPVPRASTHTHRRVCVQKCDSSRVYARTHIPHTNALKHEARARTRAPSYTHARTHADARSVRIKPDEWREGKPVDGSRRAPRMWGREDGSRLFPFPFVVIHVFFTSDGSERNITGSIFFRRLGTLKMRKLSKDYIHLHPLCIICLFTVLNVSWRN